ncbi:helix-turn-helix domain-containing protein [Streptomyces sp. SID8014]|uniref:helix-turn-helix domain-containing protein n=1 Tax=Streptomyces sp. SID8014 TaxID=2706097 RepID=UPI0013B9A65F|nr:helix-turn-helix domain-containing protein [Streptomyces sp. SID8014]NEC12911.1 helix-turn-helix domain-containing protein [Streptomyces sp. SID8014]
MARWAELPAGLDRRERQLVVQLRRLKDHSGLSLAALGARTGYSRSSWDRYLGGRAPVPRAAVIGLAEVCGVDPTRLLALHEVATEHRAADGHSTGTAQPGADSGPAGRSSAGEHPEPPGPPGGRRRTVVAAALLVGALALGFAAGLTTGLVSGPGTRVAAGPGGVEGPDLVRPDGARWRRGTEHPCEVRRAGGLLHAGHSRERAAYLDINSAGWHVVEAQCLLRHHGFDPGSSDGLYGPAVQAAVRRLQADRRIPVDGVVGPDTWGELRR